MKTKLILILIACAALSAYAGTITFTGVITTAEVYLEPSGGIMGNIGDKVYGFVTFYPYNSDPSDLVVSDAGMRFPGGWTGSNGGQYLSAVPGGYYFYTDTFGGFGEDGLLEFTVFLNGSGTFLAGSSDPDGDGAYQIYTGNIVRVSTPDSGSTLMILSISLVGLGLARCFTAHRAIGCRTPIF
jgi:hypothetical protein